MQIAMQTPMQAAMLTAIMALSATLFGHALQIRDGFYDERALAWLVLTILCCAIAALRGLPTSWLRWNTEAVVSGVLVAGIISNLLALAVSSPGVYLTRPDPNHDPLFLAGLATAGLLMVAGVSGVRALQRLWFPLMLVTFAGLGLWLIAASPR